MRATFAASALWLALAASANAIPYVPPPQPIYEAPIDRALDNVAAMEGVSESQREQLLGRLNLIAYARNDPRFTYRASDNRLNLSGSVLCSEAAQPHIGFGGSAHAPPSYGPDERCAAFEFNLGPEREIVDTPAAEISEAALARLAAARTHYARAVALDSANLRARLGYAYVLDRLGEMDGARAELREIVALGLPQLAGAQADWETHAVLTEAATHLAHVATTVIEKKSMLVLRVRLGVSQPIMYVTPVVAPLTDRPFDALVEVGSEVAFDFAGTGDVRAQGWLTSDAAWLVWDPEWRGAVRSGFDMIGQRTWAVFWTDGFEALRALDDNRDGELTGAELGGLALWRDADVDGVSDPGEVLPVNVHGVAGLSVEGAATRPGLITAPHGIRFEDGRTLPLYDWTPGLGEGAPVS